MSGLLLLFLFAAEVPGCNRVDYTECWNVSFPTRILAPRDDCYIS